MTTRQSRWMHFMLERETPEKSKRKWNEWFSNEEAAARVSVSNLCRPRWNECRRECMIGKRFLETITGVELDKESVTRAMADGIDAMGKLVSGGASEKTATISQPEQRSSLGSGLLRPFTAVTIGPRSPRSSRKHSKMLMSWQLHLRPCHCLRAPPSEHERARMTRRPPVAECRIETTPALCLRVLQYDISHLGIGVDRHLSTSILVHALEIHWPTRHMASCRQDCLGASKRKSKSGITSHCNAHGTGITTAWIISAVLF